MSDMAAASSGHPQTDHIRIIALGEAAARVRGRGAGARAAPSSPRCWAAGPTPKLVARLNRAFAKVAHVKPPASRKDSSEKYLVATGFRGAPAAPAPPV